ncbi:MAG TPA: 50S ribosomal protein L29 [Candidatus Dormibacteraeota bacterium]|jgi:large subunit ribosomal protein L29
MKVDELRVLEADELGVRLKTARRELYELRFKHAVGQLENSSQISKVRHDIARIMTVLTERSFGIVALAVAEAEPPVAVAEPVEEAAPVKPKRTRAAGRAQGASAAKKTEDRA